MGLLDAVRDDAGRPSASPTSSTSAARPRRRRSRVRSLSSTISSTRKWYFDELYDVLFVGPAKAVGHFLWRRGDEKTINRYGPDGIAARVMDTARGVGRLQSGYLYHYAFAMLIGVAAMITYFMFQSFG